MAFGRIALADLCRRHGDLDAAETAAREALRIARRLPLRRAPLFIDVMIQLADGIQSRAPAEAGQLYREARRFAEERPADNARHLETLRQRLDRSP
jgi:hypothetical protein